MEKYDTHLVYAADEFYLAASLPFPSEADYDGYPQLDNGVGLIRSAREEILDEIQWRWEEGDWKSLPKKELTLTLANLLSVPVTLSLTSPVTLSTTVVTSSTVTLYPSFPTRVSTYELLLRLTTTSPVTSASWLA